MSNAIVFIVFWMSAKTNPTAQFVGATHSMKECTELVAKVADPEIKRNMSCMQVVAVMPDSSESF
jgi:hypothetical protein